MKKKPKISLPYDPDSKYPLTDSVLSLPKKKRAAGVKLICDLGFGWLYNLEHQSRLFDLMSKKIILPQDTFKVVGSKSTFESLNKTPLKRSKKI